MCDCEYERGYKLGYCAASQCTRNTTKICLDGIEVKTGDKLYCILYGWGTVSSLDYSSIYVDFINTTRRYFKRGELCGNDRTLFWDVPTIVPPKPPKKKVKKYKYVIKDVYIPPPPTGAQFRVTASYYKNDEEIKRLLGWAIVISRIDASEIEVEE